MSEYDTLTEIKTYLAEEFGMDGDDIKEMTDIFFESIDSILSELDTNLASENFDALSKLGHTVKGSAANIGAAKTSEIGRELQDAAKLTDAAKCAKLVASLKEAISLIKTENTTEDA